MVLAATRKLDRRKELAAFCTASAAPKVVDVPALNYLAVDGMGDRRPD